MFKCSNVCFITFKLMSPKNKGFERLHETVCAVLLPVAGVLHSRFGGGVHVR